MSSPAAERRSNTLAVLLAAAYGLAAYALLQLFDLGSGASAFIAVPFTMGILLGYSSTGGPGVLGLLAVVATIFLAGGIYAAGLAGVFCALTLMAITVTPIVSGALLGRLMRRFLLGPTSTRGTSVPLVLLALTPLPLAWIEARVTGVREPITILTERKVPVSPGALWRDLVFFEEIRTRPPLLLRLGLPRPSHVEGSHQNVGDIAVCVYHHGRLVKQITGVTPARRLAFRVLEQDLHFEHDVQLLGGSFDLEDLGEEGTHLRLATTYRPLLGPRWIWLPLERWAVHTLHHHVIDAIEIRGERAPGALQQTASHLAATSEAARSRTPGEVSQRATPSRS